jgi:hypothetical protein
MKLSVLLYEILMLVWVMWISWWVVGNRQKLNRITFQNGVSNESLPSGQTTIDDWVSEEE